ncbi:MAG: AtpZ/AtpI family protein [Acidobacteriia bacterium]|nr:AtpZ/AtpI family protein [Terriglobia bacterium]
MSGPVEVEPGSSGPSPWSYVGLGFEIAVPLLLGVVLGRRLDVWLGTGPWLLLVGAALGMAAGFLAFFRTVLPPRGGAGDGVR